MSHFYPTIQEEDPEVYDAIMGEEKRQKEGLELIPSENYVSRAVREANSSVLTNKYSEGYPGTTLRRSGKSCYVLCTS